MASVVVSHMALVASQGFVAQHNGFHRVCEQIRAFGMDLPLIITLLKSSLSPCYAPQGFMAPWSVLLRT